MPSKPTRRIRGEGSLTQRKNGMWVASVQTGDYDAKGRPKRKQLTSMDYNIAVAKLRQLRADADAGILATISHTTTVADWLDTWMETVVKPHTKPTTYSTYRAEVNGIKKQIGSKRVTTLTSAQIRQMLATVSREKSTGTAMNYYRRLSKALGDAKREGLIRDNPCERVKAPKVERADRGNHNLDEARAVIGYLLRTEDVDELSRWTLALFTGVRQAEAIGLTWDRVDLDAGHIDISLSLQRVPLRDKNRRPAGTVYPVDAFDIEPGTEITPVWRGWCLIDTKTSSSERLVPMVPPLHAALQAHHDALGNPSEGLVWTRPATSRGEAGRPWDKGADEDRWKAMLAAAGVRELTQHSARHTVATLLQEAGVPEATRMAILGHSTRAMARHYAHVDVSLARDALGKLDDLLKLES